MLGSSAISTNIVSHKEHHALLSDQLHSFRLLVSSLADAAPERPFHSQESSLTRLIRPIMAENSKTFMLLTVMPDAKHFRPTTDTLRLTSRALSVSCACARVKVRLRFSLLFC